MTKIEYSQILFIVALPRQKTGRTYYTTLQSPGFTRN